MQLGLILPHLGASQLSYLAIHHANHMNRQGNPVILFYEDLVEPCIPLISPCMNVNEIWGFDGLLIATSIDSCLAMINAPNPSKKVFYVWDLEWLRGKTDFEYNNRAYRHEKVELVCRSESHADILENYSNRRATVIPDLFLPKFVELFVPKAI